MNISLNIDSGDTEHRSRDVSAQTRINLYPERQPYSGAASEWILTCAPGTKPYLLIGSGDIRGLYKAGNGSLYVVKGRHVYEINDRSGEMTVYQRGDLLSDASPVKMTDNGTHLAIVDGMDLYLHALGSTDDIYTITKPFAAPTHIVFIGGRLVCNATSGSNEDRNKVWYSDVYNAESWGALNFFSAEAFSDPVVALAVRLGDLCVFGSDSFEIFALTGNAYNPFSRIGSAMIGIGCSAPYSVTTISDSVVFLGGSKGGENMVYMLNGYNVSPISDHTIITRLSDTKTAIGWSYAYEGHMFYVLRSGNTDTWCYDLTTAKWHRRRGLNNDYSPCAWKALYSESFNGKNVVGFLGSDYLCEISGDALTDADGKQIIRTYRSNNVLYQGKRLKHKALLVLIDSGHNAVYGSDAIAMMRFSDDGGYSWSRSFWQSFGQKALYNKALRWSSLGSSRERVFEIQISDVAYFSIIGAFVDVDIGI